MSLIFWQYPNKQAQVRWWCYSTRAKTEPPTPNEVSPLESEGPIPTNCSWVTRCAWRTQLSEALSQSLTSGCAQRSAHQLVTSIPILLVHMHSGQQSWVGTTSLSSRGTVGVGTCRYRDMQSSLKNLCKRPLIGEYPPPISLACNDHSIE